MLIGPKICLGPMFQDDARVLFNWRNRLDLMRLDGLYRPLSQGSFEEWFSSIGKDPSRIVFSIRQAKDLTFLGFVQVTNIHPVFRSAELGIMIGDAAERGRGYGPEALSLCVDFCWKELNLQRLSMMIIGDNQAALRAYRKAGFEVEGVLRRSAYVHGAFRDAIVLGLLRPATECAPLSSVL